MTSQAEKQRQEMENSEEDTDSEIMGEAVSPTATIRDWGNLQARQQTRFEWTVLNLKEDEDNTAYLVNTRELDCSCGDQTYSPADDNATVCKHLSVALWASKQQADTEELSRWSMQHELAKVQEARQEVEHLAEWMNKVSTEVPSEEANESVQETNDAQQSEAAQEAAQRLQEAFDELIDDMQVQAHEGVVWFKTGYDTDDDWPYPGGDDTWEVLVGNPDQPEYVGEGGDDYPPHELYDEKPGEYWKNILQPEDVDDYIEEVLE